MKILHIYDTSGSSSIIARYQRKLGHEVKVITNARLDKFGISEFYESVLYKGSSLRFYLYVIKEARKYDVLHVHSLVRIAPYLKMLYPNKKLILQFHGSDLRLYGNSVKTLFAISLADLCLITTTDLWKNVPINYRYKFYECLNVPDVELFSDIKAEKKYPDVWLTFLESGKFWHEPIEDLKIEPIDRNETPIPYYMMPFFLFDYGGYIDIKNQNGKPLESLSKTGLEALATGLKVINWKKEILTELPNEHNPYVVAEKLNHLMLIGHRHRYEKTAITISKNLTEIKYVCVHCKKSKIEALPYSLGV